MSLPSPQEIAQAIRLGIPIEKRRDHEGNVVSLRIMWPAFSSNQEKP